MKARVLYADPPWKFADRLPGPGRGSAKHYDVLSQDDIEAFPLPLLEDDALLILWRVASQVEEAYRVVRAWGFTPKSEIVWAKTTGGAKTDPTAATQERCAHCGTIVHALDCPTLDADFLEEPATMHFGMGHYTRNNHETAIVATRGRFKVVDKAIRSVFFAPRTKHSAKPPSMHDLIEKLAGGGAGGPYVELFAREPWAGWTTFGNELPDGMAWRPWEGYTPYSEGLWTRDGVQAVAYKVLARDAEVAGEEVPTPKTDAEAGFTDPHGNLPRPAGLVKGGPLSSLELANAGLVTDAVALSWVNAHTRAIAFRWSHEEEHTDALLNRPPPDGEAFVRRHGEIPSHVLEELGVHPALVRDALRDAILARAFEAKLLSAYDQTLPPNERWAILPYVAPVGFYAEALAAFALPEPAAVTAAAPRDKLPDENLSLLATELTSRGCKISLIDVCGWSVVQRDIARAWIERGGDEPDFLSTFHSNGSSATLDDPDAARLLAKRGGPTGCSACDRGEMLQPGREFVHTGKGPQCKDRLETNGAPLADEGLTVVPPEHGGELAVPKRRRGRPPGSKNKSSKNGARTTWTVAQALARAVAARQAEEAADAVAALE